MSFVDARSIEIYGGRRVTIPGFQVPDGATVERIDWYGDNNAVRYTITVRVPPAPPAEAAPAVQDVADFVPGVVYEPEDKRIAELKANAASEIDRQRRHIAGLDAEITSLKTQRNALSYDLVSVREALDAAKRERDAWKAMNEKEETEKQAAMKQRDDWEKIEEICGWPGGSNEEDLKNMLAASEKRNEKLVADLEVNEQLMREKRKLIYNITSMEEQLASVKKNRDEWTRRHEIANKENHRLASVVREKDTRIAELENAAKPPAFEVGDRVQWSGYDGVPEKGHIVSIHDDLASAIIAMDDPEKRRNYVSLHRLQREEQP